MDLLADTYKQMLQDHTGLEPVLLNGAIIRYLLP